MVVNTHELTLVCQTGNVRTGSGVPGWLMRQIAESGSRGSDSDSELLARYVTERDESASVP